MPRRKVAVKVLLRDVVDAGLLRMFYTEADVMARLSAHPSIITVFEASVSADGRPYIVMEYCPTSLANKYRREQLAVAEVLNIGVRIAAALETAHRAGVLHRDIKPSNILISQFGAPVLSDFGIAAAITQKGHENELFAMSLPWSAPEVVAEKVSGSVPSEVWSLGATIYTLLAGHSPFQRQGGGQNTREQIADRILKARYPPLERPDVPPELDAALAAAMHKDPAARCPNAAAFGYLLQRLQVQQGLPYTPLEIPQDEWGPAPPIDLSGEQRRGPTRSTVEHESRRASSRPGTFTNRPDDEEVFDEPASGGWFRRRRGKRR